MYIGGIPGNDRDCIEDITRWVNALNELSDQLHISCEISAIVPESDERSPYAFGIRAAVLSGEHLSTCKAAAPWVCRRTGGAASTLWSARRCAIAIKEAGLLTLNTVRDAASIRTTLAACGTCFKHQSCSRDILRVC